MECLEETLLEVTRGNPALLGTNILSNTSPQCSSQQLRPRPLNDGGLQLIPTGKVLIFYMSSIPPTYIWIKLLFKNEEIDTCYFYIMKESK